MAQHMTQDYQLALAFLNAWPHIPCTAHFEGRASAGTPDLILEAQKGGTSTQGGRNFRLIYRIFPDPEGEFLYAASFFDEIDRYFAENTAQTGDSTAPIAWIQRRSSMVGHRRCTNGSQEFSAEYTLYAGTTRQDESTTSDPQPSDDSAPDGLPQGCTIALNGVPLTGENGLKLLSAEGMLSPDYLIRSQPMAFGEGSAITAHLPIGRTIRLTVQCLTAAGRSLLGRVQSGEVTCSITDPAGKIYRSLCRWAGAAEKSGGKTVVELSSPNPYWESGEEITAFGEAKTLTLDGQAQPVWSLHLVTGTEPLAAPTLTINGRALTLAATLEAAGEFLVEGGVLYRLTGGARVRMADFLPDLLPGLALGENTVQVTASSGRPTAMTFTAWKRWFSV